MHEDVEREKPRRPRALIPLYISTAALATLDIQTTLHAHSHGANEANPLIAGLEDYPVELSLLKGLGFGATVGSSELLWRAGHPRLAIATMLVANAIALAAVINNLNVIAVQERIVPPQPEPAPGPAPAGSIEIRMSVRFGAHGLQFDPGHVK